MRNFKNILTMVVGSLSILFYTQVGSATTSPSNGTSKAAAGITDRAGSISDAEDHSGLARIFLLCDEGSTSGVQSCQIYAQVMGGVTGVISDESFSAIALSAAGTITADVYGSSANIQTGTSVSPTKGVTANLVAVSSSGTAPSAQFTLSEGVLISAVTGNADQQDNNADWTSATNPTGDLCRKFKSNLKADGYHSSAGGSSYSAASANIAPKLAALDTNDALFLLQGFMGNTFTRNSIGYAESFTVPYTITVTSNTAGTDTNVCD